MFIMHWHCSYTDNNTVLSACHAGGQAYQNLRQGGLSLLPGFSTTFANMLRKLMSANPAERPTPEKVLASPLLVKKLQKEVKPQSTFGALNLQPSKVQ